MLKFNFNFLYEEINQRCYMAGTSYVLVLEANVNSQDLGTLID